jgi:hypothetical protein
MTGAARTGPHEAVREVGATPVPSALRGRAPGSRRRCGIRGSSLVAIFLSRTLPTIVPACRLAASYPKQAALAFATQPPRLSVKPASVTTVATSRRFDADP